MICSAALKFFWTCVALKLVDDDDNDDDDDDVTSGSWKFLSKSCEVL